MKINKVLEIINKRFAVCALAAIGVASLCVTISETSAESKGTEAKPAIPRYNITDLGSLRGGGEVNANDINDKGQVAGFAPGTGGPRGGGWHPFIWEQGKMKDLGRVPGSFEGRAYAINEKGEVFGHAIFTKGSSKSFHAFIWANGKMNLIDSYEEPRTFTIKGEKIANLRDSGNVNHRAVLYRSGKTIELGGKSTRATAINNKSQIVGSSGFATVEADFPSDSPSEQKASSRMRGRTRDTFSRAFMWEDGKIKNLGTLPKSTDSYAIDINDAGQVIGNTSNIDGDYIGGGDPFLWQNGQIYNLNDLVNQKSKSDWVLGRATALNNRGQIVGMGAYKGVGRAFLLTPK